MSGFSGLVTNNIVMSQGSGTNQAIPTFSSDSGTVLQDNPNFTISVDALRINNILGTAEMIEISQNGTISLGTTPATTGTIRLENTATINAI